MPHTPGPYVSFDNGNNTHNIISYGGGRTGLVAVTFHLPVSPEHNEEATEEANAYLIAAAPDLLAACKEVETQLAYMLEIMAHEGEFYANADSECDSRLKTIRAALAKAKGGAA